MTLLVPDDAEVVMLKSILNHTAPQNQVLKLFKNDITPAENHVAADFTEADFTGYAGITLTGTSWSFAAGDPSAASYAEQTFASAAGSQSQNVYGYYVVQATSGKLLWAERFTTGPYLIQNNGDEIRVTPAFTLS